MSRNIRAGRAFVELGAERAGLAQDLRAAEGLVRNFGNRVQAIGRSMLGIGALASAAIIPAVSLFAGFQETMSAVQAVTGATGEAFTALTAKARELGASTSFSAREAAEGMRFLGMAGFDTQQILAGIPAVLNLAKAGAVELGIAADIASDVSSAFGLTAEEIERVADVMAKAASSANVTIEGLGESFKFAAPAGNAAGQSIEEVSAALGTLGSSGLKGSIAGRNLMIIFKQLSSTDVQARLKEMNVEVADAQGNFRDLSDIMRDLREPLAKLTEVERVRFLNEAFAESAKSAQILVSQADGFTDLRHKLDNAAGAAAEMSSLMADNLMGDFRTFLSAAQETAIALGTQLEPALRNIMSRLTESVKHLGEWIQENQSLVIAVTAAAVVIGGLGAALTAAGLAITLAATAIGGFKTLVVLANTALGFLSKSNVTTAATTQGYTASATAAAQATAVWSASIQSAVANLGRLQLAITGTAATQTTMIPVSGAAVKNIELLGTTTVAASSRFAFLKGLLGSLGRVAAVAFTPIVAKVALVVGAVAAIGAGLVSLQKHFDVFTPLLEAFQEIKRSISTDILPLFGELTRSVGELFRMVGELAAAIGTTLLSALKPAGALFTAFFGELRHAVKGAADSFLAAWNIAIAGVKTALETLTGAMNIVLSGLESTGLVVSRDERERGARLDRQLAELQARRQREQEQQNAAAGDPATAADRKPVPANGAGELPEDVADDAASTIADSLQSFAESVRRSVQNPQEAFEEYMQGLDAAFAAGLLTAEEYRRGVQQQEAELQETAERERQARADRQQAIDAANRGKLQDQVRTNVDLARANGDFLGEVKALSQGAVQARRSGFFELAEELAQQQLETLAAEATALEERHDQSLQEADIVTASASQAVVGLGTKSVDREALEESQKMRRAMEDSRDFLRAVRDALED